MVTDIETFNAVAVFPQCHTWDLTIGIWIPLEFFSWVSKMLLIIMSFASCSKAGVLNNSIYHGAFHPHANLLRSLVLNLKPHWDIVYLYFHPIGFKFPKFTNLKHFLQFLARMGGIWSLLKSIPILLILLLWLWFLALYSVVIQCWRCL